MYAIAGVSGHTGRVVAERLLAAGRGVRVIVRDAAKGEAWAKKGAEVAVADLDDAAALEAAFAGAEGAYVLLPPTPTADDVGAVQAARVAALVAAVAGAKVPHVVLLSSIGAHLASGTGPIVGLHHAERALAAVAPRFTALRAGYFLENWGSALGGLADGVFPTFVGADTRVEMVASWPAACLEPRSSSSRAGRGTRPGRSRRRSGASRGAR